MSSIDDNALGDAMQPDGNQLNNMMIESYKKNLKPSIPIKENDEDDSKNNKKRKTIDSDTKQRRTSTKINSNDRKSKKTNINSLI
jgi:hypothetical protein